MLILTTFAKAALSSAFNVIQIQPVIPAKMGTTSTVILAALVPEIVLLVHRQVQDVCPVLLLPRN
jgi:hypothetical protein